MSKKTLKIYLPNGQQVHLQTFNSSWGYKVAILKHTYNLEK